MSPNKPYHHRLLRSLEEFLELEAEWEHAAASATSPQPPTTMPAWTYGQWQRHRGRRDVRLLAVWHEGRLVLVFPHIVERHRGHAVVVEGLCEIVPLFACAPVPEHIDYFVHALRAEYTRMVLHMEQIDPAWDVTRTFLSAMSLHGAHIVETPTHENVVVDLRPGWEAFSAALSANTREGLRKARRRLRVDAASAVVHCYGARHDLANGIEAMLRVDRMSWKVERGGAMCRSDQEDVQFTHAIQRFARGGAVRLYVLEIEEEPAAFIIAFVLGRTAYFAIWTYADHAAHFMPGKVIMAEALRSLAQEGVERVDFWGRNDRFKASWSRLATPRHRLRIGLGLGAIDGARAAASAAARTLGTPLRAIVNGRADRYRLRRDRPSPLERWLLLPAARLNAAVRDRRLGGHVDVHAGEDYAGGHVVAMRATALDRFHLRVGSFDPSAELIAFKVEGRLAGAVILEPSPGPRNARVTYLRLLDGAAPWPSCVAALSRLLPRLRRLYLPATFDTEEASSLHGQAQHDEHPVIGSAKTHTIS